METITISKATIERTVGSIWCVDHDGRIAYEVMGSASPPLYFGEVQPDLASATEAWPSEYRARPIPDNVRVPRQTPFPIEGGPEMSTVAAALYLVRFDFLLDKGLRIERVAVDAAEYAPPPHHLANAGIDFVATAVYFTAGGRFRSRISNSADGKPKIADIHEVSDGLGLQKPAAISVYLSEAEAVRAADGLARRLIGASDWRSNSGADSLKPAPGTGLRSPWTEGDSVPYPGR